MEKSFFIVIPRDFAFDLQSRESRVNPGSLFGFAQTIDGRYVCSSNCINDFPDEFALLGQNFDLSVITLEVEDFPQTPPIK